jgi:hypothetical protein
MSSTSTKTTDIRPYVPARAVQSDYPVGPAILLARASLTIPHSSSIQTRMPPIDPITAGNILMIVDILRELSSMLVLAIMPLALEPLVLRLD